LEQTEGNGIHHLIVSERFCDDSIAVSLHYEVYDNYPAVRKWLEIKNIGDHWLKVDRLVLDDPLIGDWRSHFAQGDLPFLYVQLSSFDGPHGWGMIRDAQRRVLSLRNTAMVVTLDVGEPANIHPADKQTVAARLALAARGMVYGEDIPFSSPLFREATTEPGGMRVWFDHAKGLTTHGRKLEGFEIAGADHQFVRAEAEIDGETVVVRNSTVTYPVFVRYAWGGVAPPVFYNAAGLPGSTFTSEKKPSY
jgi:sialate O-acetylesterase